jgi:hypothetical protein
MIAITNERVDLIFVAVMTVVLLTWVLWPAGWGSDRNDPWLVALKAERAALKAERARAAGRKRRARRRARWAWLRR